MSCTVADTPKACAADLIRAYIRALLERNLALEQDRQERIRTYEQSGHRIVSGGQIGLADDGQSTWEYTDWRTGEVIASGCGSTEHLDPEGEWIHIDYMPDDDGDDVETGGVPESLAENLRDWLGTTTTPDEDVAFLAGWPLDVVRRYRCSD
ncbi:hypothetical protein [Streptomyces anulatus]|uniref:hypothetical protein n=1 Tax=Streptomyces anulatus TaxID=1892 RepID=UPI002F9134AA